MSETPHPLLSFASIRRQWAELNIPLYPVHLRPADYPQLDAQTLAFLDEVGFPEAAEPELDFTDLSEKLFTHTQLYAREDFPVLDQYLVIGATGEGNPICIDTTDGTIVYIDHDHGFESIFINTSLLQLGYCLAVYTEVTAGDTTAASVSRLRLALHEADPACLAVGAFWETELGHLERRADG